MQLTIDPAEPLAVARATSASIAAELGRYASLGWVVAALAFITAANSVANEQLVEEDTVRAWGYETVSVSEWQTIRRVEPHRLGSSVYYPRFHLWRECFDTSSEPSQKLEKLRHAQATDVAARDFDYRRGFVVGKCLYLMNTNAMLYKLEFQDELFLEYESYIRARARDA
ncbi:MAG: hypothetical protein AAF680_00165 [Pseudomonadota bacterium]